MISSRIASPEYDNETDKVLIRLKPVNGGSIPVKGIFDDGVEVMELYTGQTSVVHDGVVSFTTFDNNVAILREIK